MTYDFDHLDVSVADGVATVLIDNPPINLMTPRLFRSLAKCSAQLAIDDEVRVVVLRSAVPGFFIAHFDVEAIMTFPIDGDAVEEPELGGFDRMCEAFRTMPKVTIAEIRGRVGGGGGTQRIPRLIGSGRAMDVVLGAVDIDGPTAERWGFLNRALPGEQLTSFVDGLARRIAAFPPEAVRLAKRAVLTAEDRPLVDGLRHETFLFQQLLRHPDARPAIGAFLDAGGQTPAGESRVGDLMGEIWGG